MSPKKKPNSKQTDPNPASSVHPHLIYKDDCQGYYRQKALDDVFDEIIEIDREDVRYYLLANLNAYFGAIFSLLTSTSCGVKECLEPTYGDVVLLRRDWFSPEFYEDKHVEETKLIFNPKDLTWKACRKNKKGDWADFPDSKTFRLKFEDKIKIVMD